jgi:outer membrane usher protein
VSEVSSRSGNEPGSFSWRTRIAEGAGAGERLASASYVTPHARIEAGLQHTQGRATAFAQATGALAVASGGVFASRRIDGAFAVVEAGAPGVPVLFENRPVGKTGRNGRLLIPDLLPYQVNKVALDTRFLPLDRHVEQQDYAVVPRRGSGATVKLAAARISNVALVTFVESDGQPLAVGSVGRLEGGSTDFVVGYDGEAYVPD